MSSAFILESRNKDLPHTCSGPPRGISCVLNDRLEETTQALSKKVPSVYLQNRRTYQATSATNLPPLERRLSTTQHKKSY
jgi:hypothetical protein